MKTPSTRDDTPPFATAFPPWHASALVGAMLATSIATFPQDLDKLAKLETFTHRVFPDFISLPTLAAIRLMVAASCWLVTIYMIFVSTGWDINTTYRPLSKLRNAELKISGFKTLCPFTSWSWIMLGSTFSLTGYIALMEHFGRGQEIDQWIFRSALVLWELSAPFALLVSAVVRYAIWPVVLATGRPHKLGSFRNQMQHNVNSIFVLSEMALLGGPPIEFAHLSLHLFVGAIYILFTWLCCYSYAPAEFGPQYIYWFMDVSLDTTTTVALLALLATLVMSFVTFSAIETIVQWTGASLVAHFLSVIIVSSAVIKSR